METRYRCAQSQHRDMVSASTMNSPPRLSRAIKRPNFSAPRDRWPWWCECLARALLPVLLDLSDLDRVLALGAITMLSRDGIGAGKKGRREQAVRTIYLHAVEGFRVRPAGTPPQTHTPACE